MFQSVYMLTSIIPSMNMIVLTFCGDSNHRLMVVVVHVQTSMQTAQDWHTIMPEQLLQMQNVAARNCSSSSCSWAPLHSLCPAHCNRQ